MALAYLVVKPISQSETQQKHKTLQFPSFKFNLIEKVLNHLNVSNDLNVSNLPVIVLVLLH